VPEDGEPGANPAQSSIRRTQATPYSTSSLPSRNGGMTSWLRALFGLKSEDTNLKAALQEVLDEHSNGLTELAPEERRILTNILDFGEVVVNDIMVPQSKIVAIEADASLDDVRSLMIEDRHTRVPVYEDTIDQVRGFIHVKDLVPLLGGENKGFHVEQIMRSILFVPPSMKIADLLLKMRKAGIHIAIVVDEYGGTIGLVTLEDIFEEIVGDVQDEHDETPVEMHLHWDTKGTIILDATTLLERIESDLGLTVIAEDEEVDYDTIGGFVMNYLGRVPTRGETINHPVIGDFEIVDADARRIKKIRLNRPALVDQAVAG
jgi:magnesium and cobalt transporter